MKVKLSKMSDNGAMTEIIIEITPDGGMSALVEGVVEGVGQSCEEISRFLNDMGIVVQDDPTGDFYQMTQELEYA